MNLMQFKRVYRRNVYVLLTSHVSYFSIEKKMEFVQPSINSMKTINPIRKIFDNLYDYEISKDKELKSLAIGDPTKYIDPPPSIRQAMLNAYNAPNTVNSYCNSHGLEAARVAISKQYTNSSPNDVVLTGGGQGAIDVAYYSLLNDENDNVLLPEPCWPEYVTNLNKYGFSYKYYKLLPENQWQIDTQHLESLIDKNTKAILTNSPSNPCGSVLKYETMYNVLKIADKYKIPIISDEIYSNIIFPLENVENKFISYATVKKQENISVPVMITSGLAKNYLVPGWKVGYLVFCDENNELKLVKQGIHQLLQVNFGPSSLCQYMIADILEHTEDQFWIDLSKKLYEQSKLFCELINDNIPELHAIAGQAAFYIMVKIHLEKLKDIDTDYQFFERILAEQGVFILPGNIFKMDGYFRAVICAPNDILIEVADRLKEFCEKHRNN